MRYSCVLLLATTFLVGKSTGAARLDPTPEDATLAVLHAFETHDVVAFGEIHGNKQEYDWLRSLISTAAFADRVDDIVMEFGNALYQKSVDRYIVSPLAKFCEECGAPVAPSALQLT